MSADAMSVQLRRQALLTGLARRAISKMHGSRTTARVAAQALVEAGGATWASVALPGEDRPVTAGEPPAEHAERLVVAAPGSEAGHVTLARAAPPFADDERAFAGAVAEVVAVGAERERQDEEARATTGRDHVTGLPGRELFVRTLEHELWGSSHAGALLVVDLNQFGLVNDTLGPEAGDVLLRKVAERLESAVDARVGIARIGGDTFALRDRAVTSTTGAIDLAKRVLRAFRAPFDLDGVGHHASASIGVLLLPAGAYGHAQEALRDVHVAQRRATAAGRGRWELFDAGMRQGLEQRRTLEHQLRQALDRREFRLVYQPLVDLATGRVLGAEALLRWEHPDRGLLGPGEFIEVAEASDLIIPIGAWVLREALRQLRAWQDSVPALGDFRLSINLSGRQLADPAFPAQVARLLRSYDLDPGRIEFELTETALVAEGPQVEDAVRALTAIGTGLALDDFGTGYASLRYVRRFPFDTLKLDRSFLAGSEPEDVALVTAAIAMGRALGMHVLAEGIERTEQLEAIRAMGCELGQGYLFARPLAASGLRTLLWRGGEGS